MARIRRGQIDPHCVDDEQQRDELPIISGDNEYGGRGAKLTAVVVDGDKAWFDEAALHGRTALEQSVSWVSDPSEVPSGRKVHPVWVYIRPAARGSFQYYGVVAASMLVDEANAVGHKPFGDHVNKLSDAMKGKVDLAALDDAGRTALLQALQQYPEVLENSSDDLKEALGLPAEAASL